MSRRNSDYRLSEPLALDEDAAQSQLEGWSKDELLQKLRELGDRDTSEYTHRPEMFVIARIIHILKQKNLGNNEIAYRPFVANNYSMPASRQRQRRPTTILDNRQRMNSRKRPFSQIADGNKSTADNAKPPTSTTTAAKSPPKRRQTVGPSYFRNLNNATAMPPPKRVRTQRDPTATQRNVTRQRKPVISQELFGSDSEDDDDDNIDTRPDTAMTETEKEATPDDMELSVEKEERDEDEESEKSPSIPVARTPPLPFNLDTTPLSEERRRSQPNRDGNRDDHRNDNRDGNDNTRKGRRSSLQTDTDTDFVTPTSHRNPSRFQNDTPVEFEQDQDLEHEEETNAEERGVDLDQDYQPVSLLHQEEGYPSRQFTRHEYIAPQPQPQPAHIPAPVADATSMMQPRQQSRLDRGGAMPIPRSFEGYRNQQIYEHGRLDRQASNRTSVRKPKGTTIITHLITTWGYIEAGLINVVKLVSVGVLVMVIGVVIAQVIGYPSPNFCDTGSTTISGEDNISCIPCPYEATCSLGEMYCESPFVRKYNRCVMDDAVTYLANRMDNQMKHYLSQLKGAHECGAEGVIPNMSQKNIQRYLRETLYLSTADMDIFDTALEHFINEVSANHLPPLYTIPPSQTNTDVLLASDTAQYTYSCSISKWYYAHTLEAAIVGCVICVLFIRLFTHWRQTKYENKVHSTKESVFELLSIHRNNVSKADSYLPINVVRERLGITSDLLWNDVQLAVRKCSEIRDSQKIVGGIQTGCWHWCSPMAFTSQHSLPQLSTV